MVSALSFARMVDRIASLATLARGVRNFPQVAWRLLAQPSLRSPFTVRLASGDRFRVRTALDVWVLKEVVLDREYQRIGPDVAPGWTVVDIGAAHGEFAIPAARRVGAGRIIAVEPAPATCALLRENVVLNGAFRVEVLPLAVGAYDGTARLALSQRGTALNSTAAGPAGGHAIDVPVVTLETLFATTGVVRCDYLKVDCEGGEFDILLGAPDATLRRVARACVEFHDDATPHRHPALARRLAAAGFAVRIRANPLAPARGWLYAERSAGA